MPKQSHQYPFTAVVGQEKMKRALILNAVNPKLSGVIIRGEKGTAKSTAVRALATLLPQIDIVKDCPFGCHPDRPQGVCGVCEDSVAAGKKESHPKESRKTRVVELPINATEDRVIGTLNLEHALKKGREAF